MNAIRMNDADDVLRAQLLARAFAVIADMEENYIDNTHAPIDRFLKDVKINSASFKNSLQSIETKLEETTHHLSIMKLANFICRKLHEFFRLSSRPKMERLVLEKTADVVSYGDNMRNVFRIYHTKFVNQEIAYRISKRSYYTEDNTLKNDFTPYFQVFKSILRSPYLEEKVSDDILQELQDLFDDEKTNEFVKMDIADVLILSNHREIGEPMLEELRYAQRMREMKEGGLTRGQGTIYQDSQNVHATNINQSVLRVSKNLIQLEKRSGCDIDRIQEELCELAPNEEVKAIIRKVLERVQMDTSVFEYKREEEKKVVERVEMNMYVIFSNLWHYINRHQYSKELKERLIEEFSEMEVYCSTGHLSRLINVIQGYTEDENLQIRISDKEQLYSRVKTYLDRELKQNASTEVLEAMFDDIPDPFYDFVCTKVNEMIPEFLKDSDELKAEDVHTCVVKYTATENILLENNRLTFIRHQVEEEEIEQEETEETEEKSRTRCCMF